ncbi:hypothetical protein FOZ63_025769 [Perkinsus olseni]|uniref:Uncharacterized protein n=1 Tax=Perkinsus olseni TaxID=32597 RepID=A0A7J6PR89_PEROL|nr:hypothetical protein FOZ62_014509 [Perkinsus olseni]KAF4757149.1 hypothetical protein FOZ63_025769 [Perkinsus olseni]
MVASLLCSPHPRTDRRDKEAKRGSSSGKGPTLLGRLLCCGGAAEEEEERIDGNDSCASVDKRSDTSTATRRSRGSSRHSQDGRPAVGDEGVRRRAITESPSQGISELVNIERERSPYPHYHGPAATRPDSPLHRRGYPSRATSTDVLSGLSEESSASGSSSETLAAKTIGRRMLYGRDRWRHDLPPWFYSDIEKQQARSSPTPPSSRLRHLDDQPSLHGRGDTADLRTYSRIYDDPSFYRNRDHGTRRADSTIGQPPDLRPYRSSMFYGEAAPEVAATTPRPDLRRYSSAYSSSASGLDLSTTPKDEGLVGESGTLKSSQSYRQQQQ